MDDKQEQVTEVRQTNATAGDTSVHRESVSTKQSIPGSVLAQRIIYYIGGVIVAILIVRFLLALFGAAEGNGFVDFVYGLSYFFVAPFFGIFGSEPSYGSSQLETSTIVAIVVYALLTAGIAKLFTIGRAHPTEV